MNFFSKNLPRWQSFIRKWPQQRRHRPRSRKFWGWLSWLLVPLCISAIVISNNFPATAQGAEITELLETGQFSDLIMFVEGKWEMLYEGYFGRNLSEVVMDPPEIAKILTKLGQQTNTKPAVLWQWPAPHQLEMALITPGNPPIARKVSGVSDQDLEKVVQQLRGEITNPRKLNSDSYLAPAQQLYDWLIRPVEAELKAEGIDTILFCLGAGLRTLPLGVLHDGNQFLIEKYAITRIPAFNMIPMDTNSLKGAKVLAMGASEFTDLNPLPAVPIEMTTITEDLWPGNSFLNQEFTWENLQKQIKTADFDIVHLATHAEFRPGTPDNSFIQLWDRQLQLDQIHEIPWNDPPLELLVLSACRTAVGDEQTELGFAGLAVQAGVKSALASLWYVSDAGTFALMTEFYRQLTTASTKASALQKAQVAMINHQVRLEKGELFNARGSVQLPDTVVTEGHQTLVHPYYWSGFTLIGSPW